MGSAVNSVVSAFGNGVFTLGLIGVLGGSLSTSSNSGGKVDITNIGVGGAVVRVTGNFALGHTLVVLNNGIDGSSVLGVGSVLGGVGGGGWEGDAGILVSVRLRGYLAFKNHFGGTLILLLGISVYGGKVVVQYIFQVFV